MPQEIDYNAVVRMAAGVGLRLGNHEGRPVFVYGKPGGFGMEFACQWLTRQTAGPLPGSPGKRPNRMTKNLSW